MNASYEHPGDIFHCRLIRTRKYHTGRLTALIIIVRESELPHTPPPFSCDEVVGVCSAPVERATWGGVGQRRPA